MTLRTVLQKISGIEWLNVALTNRIPRRTLTRFVGWLAKIEQPVVRNASIYVWRLFSYIDLSEAKKTEFRSLHDCFIRELKPGARPVDVAADIVVSPCDAIVGASGAIEDGVLLQVKGSDYTLAELVRSDDLVAQFRHGTYVTLRLTAAMYHRFHAPHTGTLSRVTHIAGDTWNVNPPTLERIPRVFCRNERAVIELDLVTGQRIVMVPVAAILVAGLKLKFINMPADRSHSELWQRTCRVPVAKGDELGWFEHGSTIIVLAPPGFSLVPTITCGKETRMGQALLALPE